MSSPFSYVVAGETADGKRLLPFTRAETISFVRGLPSNPSRARMVVVIGEEERTVGEWYVVGVPTQECEAPSAFRNGL